MAVEGIGTVVQNLADQVYGQAQNAPATAPPAAVNVGKAPVAEDTFTPSTQNNSAQSAAQEAGIFQVTPGALTAATANLVIGQANPNTNQQGAPTQNAPAVGTNGGAPQAAAGTNSNAQASTSQQVASVPGTPRATNTAAASASVQVETPGAERRAARARPDQPADPADRSHRRADSGFQSWRVP